MALKQPAFLVVLGSMALATVATGCSSSDSGSSGGASTAAGPTVSITSPVSGAAVTPTSDTSFPDVAVTLDVKNFTLKDPARTDGTPCPKGSCGHVHLMVDDGDGNFAKCSPAPAPYNEAAFSTSASVGLDYCPSIDGPHSIKAELHNDDHSPVNGSNGQVITSNVVSITASGAADGG